MDIEKTPVPTYDYLDRAEEFLNAYKRLERQGLFDWARYLMIGHAVEVALKAYLLPRGWTMQGLQDRFGHRLVPLLTEAKAKGLLVSADAEKRIGYLAHVHGNYLARYPEYKGKTTNDGKGIVAVEELEVDVEELMKAIRIGLTPLSLRTP
jgi:HEPN domain-containing protein